MSSRTLLRALVASAAVLTALAPADAVETTFCMRDVDCVAIAADWDGSVEAQVDTAGTCPDDSPPAAACVRALSVGTSVSNPPPPPPPSGPHLYTGGCSHAPDPWDGRKVEVTARIAVVPHGSTSVAGETACRVYVAGVLKGTVRATVATGTAMQGFLVAPYSLRVCTTVTARWADGHTEGFQSAGRGCVPEDGS